MPKTFIVNITKTTATALMIATISNEKLNFVSKMGNSAVLSKTCANLTIGVTEKIVGASKGTTNTTGHRKTDDKIMNGNAVVAQEKAPVEVGRLELVHSTKQPCNRRNPHYWWRWRPQQLCSACPLQTPLRPRLSRPILETRGHYHFFLCRCSPRQKPRSGCRRC